MKGFVFGTAVIGVLAISVAMASPASPAPLIVQGRAIVDNGTKTGAPACASCHGAHGTGQPEAGTPQLAGMNAGYLLRQLQDFASGARNNDIMKPVAAALGAQDRIAVSAYFASLPAPKGGTGSDAAKLAQGAQLADKGDWDHGIPACSACHGPSGEGVGANFPRLAGQSADYLLAQLKSFGSGARHNDPLRLMSAIAAKLNAGQMTALAAYYAAKPDSEIKPAAAVPAKSASTKAGTAFAPPPDSAIPNDEFGDIVKLGQNVFRNTGHYAKDFVGNALTCQNCHLDEGRLANSAPLWAAYVSYPAYRAKNKHVNSYAERLQGCFRYSMNGKVPPLDSKPLLALEVYSYFLAKGAPVGEDMKGRGYPKVGKPEKPMDFTRGAKIYAQNCAMCHGAHGEGQISAAGNVVFPPLWGPKSFNWGAGMGNVKNAAGFIKANMPFSKGNTLSDQDAWDVAMFVDGHERPQDPRFKGNVAQTAKDFHDGATELYGKTVNGVLLGQHSPPSGPR